MEKIVKRLLLHNNRENEEIKEIDFDELKQDVQRIRFEMLTGLSSTKEDALNYMQMFHAGLSMLGDLVYSDEPTVGTGVGVVAKKKKSTETDDENVRLSVQFARYKAHEKSLSSELVSLVQAKNTITFTGKSAASINNILMNTPAMKKPSVSSPTEKTAPSATLDEEGTVEATTDDGDEENEVAMAMAMAKTKKKTKDGGGDDDDDDDHATGDLSRVTAATATSAASMRGSSDVVVADFSIHVLDEVSGNVR